MAEIKEELTIWILKFLHIHCIWYIHGIVAEKPSVKAC